MKNICLLFTYLVIFYPFISQAQSLTSEVYKTHSNGNPEVVYYFNGEQRESNKVKMERFSLNGEKVFEEHYENKLLHGKQIEWHVIEEGKTRMNKEYNYANGHLDGLQKDWFYDGSVKNEFNYTHGILDGKQLSYFEKDQLKFELYYSNGKPHGKQIEWTRERTKKYELNFIEGKLYGFQRWWHYNGTVHEEDWNEGILTIETTRNGQKVLSEYTFVLDSTSISLDPEHQAITEYRNLQRQIHLHSNGKPAEEQVFSPITYYKSWYKNGNLKTKGPGKLKDRTGEWVEYHDNAQKAGEGAYKDNRKEGKWKTWNEKGWLIAEEEYNYYGITKNRIHNYYADGKKKSEGDLRVSSSFKYGSKDGKWKYWHPNGKVKREEVYKPGPYSGNRPFIKIFTEWHSDGKVKLKGTDGKALRYYYDSSDIKIAEIQLIYRKSRGMHEYYIEGRLTIDPDYEKKRGGGSVLGYTYQEGFPVQLDEFYLNGTKKASFRFCINCFIPPNPRAVNMNEYRNLKLPPIGTLEGTQEGWYENGNRRYNYIFKDGCLFGEQKEWRSDSSPLYTLFYQNDAFLSKRDTSSKCKTYCVKGIYYNSKAKRLDYELRWDHKSLIKADGSGDYSQLKSNKKGKEILRIEAQGYLTSFLRRVWSL